MKSRIKFIQEQLKKEGLDPGPADGVLGPKTIKALNRVSGIPKNFPNKRKATAYIQLTANHAGIEAGPVDGYWGPQTQYAYEELIHLSEMGKRPPLWRPEDIPILNPHRWPKQSPDTLTDYYGEVGENQTMIDLPYPHRIAWDKTRT
ncbi:MAG: peptidoglycan-binding protein, partial [Cyclobacteriaceae bacterium]|nr:peptidoglycan-binding protein [Cyclobacteriaceae bacterium]